MFSASYMRYSAELAGCLRVLRHAQPFLLGTSAMGFAAWEAAATDPGSTFQLVNGGMHLSSPLPAASCAPDFAALAGARTTRLLVVDMLQAVPLAVHTLAYVV